jgi:hypothetical protein
MADDGKDADAPSENAPDVPLLIQTESPLADSGADEEERRHRVPPIP